MSSHEPRDSTFVFADDAGYTALTEAHGDAASAPAASSGTPTRTQQHGH